MPELHWDHLIPLEHSFYYTRCDREYFCDPITPAGVTASNGRTHKRAIALWISSQVLLEHLTLWYLDISTEDRLGTSSESLQILWIRA